MPSCTGWSRISLSLQCLHTVRDELIEAGEPGLGDVCPVGEEDESEGLVEGDALPGRVLATEPPPERRLDQRLAVRLLDLGEHVQVLVETPGRKHTSEISKSKMSMYIGNIHFLQNVCIIFSAIRK